MTWHLFTEMRSTQRRRRAQVWRAKREHTHRQQTTRATQISVPLAGASSARSPQARACRCCAPRMVRWGLLDQAQNFVSSQHLYHSAAACCLFSDMRPSSALGPTGPWPSLPSAERDSLSILPERACGGGSNLSLCTSDLSCLSEGLSNDSTARVPDVMDEWHTGTSHVAFSK